jgi:hypothetical protein
LIYNETLGNGGMRTTFQMDPSCSISNNAYNPLRNISNFGTKLSLGTSFKPIRVYKIEWKISSRKYSSLDTPKTSLIKKNNSLLNLNSVYNKRRTYGDKNLEFSGSRREKETI